MNRENTHTCNPEHDGDDCVSCQLCAVCAADRRRAEWLFDMIGLVAVVVGTAFVVLLGSVLGG